MARVDPVPDSKVLDSLYFETYYGQWTDTPSSASIAACARLINAFLLQQKRRKIDVAHPKGRLLDFGCGSADLLGELQKNGWDAYGVEPSIDVFKTLPPSLAGRVEKSLQPFVERKARFDVITMWHVLEHLADPTDTLDQIRGLLDRDDLLLVAVPNFASWEAGWAGRRWFHLDMPRHLYHYTPQTLSSLLSRCGFRIEHISFLSMGYNAFGLFQTLLNWMTPEMNFFYNQWKRGMNYQKILPFHRHLVQGILTYSLAVPLAPLSLLLSILSGFLGRSGTMEIYAHVK
ncbi:MAG: class I SAM-dependent methyltransferase [Acidobacteria bacterium]|nr:class I SAM-dependent methyltransferase [Acidobacteriota bacterium]